MSVFSKLAFWKKGGDELDFSKDMPAFGDNMGSPFGTPPGQNNPAVPKAFEEEVDPTGGDYAKQFGSTSYSDKPAMPKDDFFQPTKPFTVAQQPQFDTSYHAAKDFEIISSKLDALRAALESINQRLINVEDLVKREKKEKDKYW